MSARPDDSPLLFAPTRQRELNPTAAGLVLGTELRRLRERHGSTVTAAAKAVNASVSKLSRLERAESPPDLRDVAELATHYQVSSEVRAHLEQLARRTLEPEWFQPHADFTAAWMHRLIGLESECARLTTYEMKIVPGLLQSEGYARRIISDGLRVREGSEVEQRLALRQARQRRFFEQAAPSRATFLLDQSVLLRRVGTPQTMREQLGKLLGLVSTPGVTLRFVPLDSSVVSNHGSMTHLVFGPGGPPPMVYVEGNDDATYYAKPDDVERHVELMLRLSHEAAASWRDSRAMLLDALDRYTD